MSHNVSFMVLCPRCQWPHHVMFDATRVWENCQHLHTAFAESRNPSFGVPFYNRQGGSSVLFMSRCYRCGFEMSVVMDLGITVFIPDLWKEEYKKILKYRAEVLSYAAFRRYC